MSFKITVAYVYWKYGDIFIDYLRNSVNKIRAAI